MRATETALPSRDEATQQTVEFQITFNSQWVDDSDESFSFYLDGAQRQLENQESTLVDTMLTSILEDEIFNHLTLGDREQLKVQLQSVANLNVISTEFDIDELDLGDTRRSPQRLSDLPSAPLSYANVVIACHKDIPLTEHVLEGFCEGLRNDDDFSIKSISYTRKHPEQRYDMPEGNLKFISQTLSETAMLPAHQMRIQAKKAMAQFPVTFSVAQFNDALSRLTDDKLDVDREGALRHIVSACSEDALFGQMMTPLLERLNPTMNPSASPEHQPATPQRPGQTRQ